MKPTIIVFFLGLLLICSDSALAQTSDIGDYEKAQDQIRAFYIYNFTRYFIWPPESNTEEFVIGVLGDGTIIDELTKMAKLRKVNGRTIKIEKFSLPSDIQDGCQILYVPYEFSNYLSDAMEKTSQSSTLIISNKDGLGKFGSTVNFTTDNGKPTFELNLDAVKKRNLKCAQQLKSIAILL